MLFQIGKNTLSISELSSGKNPYNPPTGTKNDTVDNQCGKNADLK